MLRLKRDLEDGLLGGSVTKSSGGGTTAGGGRRNSVGWEEHGGETESWKNGEGEEEGERVRSDLKGRRRYEAWKAGMGVQSVRSAGAA